MARRALEGRSGGFGNARGVSVATYTDTPDGLPLAEERQMNNRPSTGHLKGGE